MRARRDCRQPYLFVTPFLSGRWTARPFFVGITIRQLNVVRGKSSSVRFPIYSRIVYACTPTFTGSLSTEPPGPFIVFTWRTMFAAGGPAAVRLFIRSEFLTDVFPLLIRLVRPTFRLFVHDRYIIIIIATTTAVHCFSIFLFRRRSVIVSFSTAASGGTIAQKSEVARAVSFPTGRRRTTERAGFRTSPRGRDLLRRGGYSRIRLLDFVFSTAVNI